MSQPSIVSKLFGSKRGVNSGNAARDAGDWNAAANHYASHVKAYPQDAAIWLQLGHAYKEQDILDLAQEAYSKALLLEPDNPETHLLMGHLKKQNGNLRQAAAHYDDAVNLVPDNLDARIQIAFTEKDLGNTETALNHYKVINKLDPSNEEVSGLIKELSAKMRAFQGRGAAKSGQSSGGGADKVAVQRLEKTVRAMASEIHRLRGIIDEVETRLLDSENSQIKAYQGLRQEFQRLEKKQIEAEGAGPLTSGRFDDLLAELTNAKRDLASKKASD